MTVISMIPDTTALTMIAIADLAAPPKRVWQVWIDPRQLERWWGPPTWPATFVEHEVVVGGRSSYFMTGPDGDTAHGWWRFLSVEEPTSLSFEDGFADTQGVPDTTLPVILARVSLTETAAGTRMTIVSEFASLEQMEQVLAMGMVEGMTLAMGQLDEVVAGD